MSLWPRACHRIEAIRLVLQPMYNELPITKISEHAGRDRIEDESQREFDRRRALISVAVRRPPFRWRQFRSGHDYLDRRRYHRVQVRQSAHPDQGGSDHRRWGERTLVGGAECEESTAESRAVDGGSIRAGPGGDDVRMEGLPRAVDVYALGGHGRWHRDPAAGRSAVSDPGFDPAVKANSAYNRTVAVTGR